MTEIIRTSPPASATPLPDLETPRLRLRARSLADTDACLAMDHEPDVTRFVAGPWSDPAAHRAFIETRTLGPWPYGHGYWSILARTEPENFLGWILLIPVPGKEGTSEIGWRLRRDAWGKGYATEAARPVMEHARGLRALDEVIAEIAPANRASMRVAEKLGMKSRGFAELPGGVALRYAARTNAGSTSDRDDLI